MENVLGLDTMTALILTGLVMGGAELIKRLFDKDWRAAAIIASSALIGGLAGMSLGITVLQGIAFGLAASGDGYFFACNESLHPPITGRKLLSMR